MSLLLLALLVLMVGVEGVKGEDESGLFLVLVGAG